MIGGRGSYSSTACEEIKVKKVKSGQNHWPLWRCLIHLFYHHRLDVVPDSGDVRHCDAKQPHCEPAGGNHAQTAADHCKSDIIRPTKTDVERAGQKHHYGTKKLPAKKNHASGEGSHQTIPLKRTDALDSAALFTGGVVHSGYRGACRTQK